MEQQKSVESPGNISINKTFDSNLGISQPEAEDMSSDSNSFDAEFGRL